MHTISTWWEAYIIWIWMMYLHLWLTSFLISKVLKFDYNVNVVMPTFIIDYSNTRDILIILWSTNLDYNANVIMLTIIIDYSITKNIIIILWSTNRCLDQHYQAGDKQVVFISLPSVQITQHWSLAWLDSDKTINLYKEQKATNIEVIVRTRFYYPV